jgi:hypothetical protein
LEPPELVAVAVGVGPTVVTLVGVAVGAVVAPDVGVAVGAVVLPDVGVAVGAVVVPLATGLAETTTPEGAVVGLRGLFAVTLPPPDEQEAAAITTVPAINASINCLYIEHSKTTRP